MWWYARCPPPVVQQQAGIQVPRGDLGAPPLEHFDCSWREGDRGQSWRAPQALLGPGIGQVDPPRVDLDGDPAQGGYAVQQGQRPSPLRQLDQVRHGLAYAGGGFRMYKGKQLGRRDRQRMLDLRHVQRLPEGHLDRVNLAAQSRRNIGHAPPEDAVLPDHHPIARL